MPEPRKHYAATLGWHDALENETLTQAAIRIAQKHGIHLYNIERDPFNPGCCLVTFTATEPAYLVALYVSEDGGALAVSNITPDMIVEVPCPHSGEWRHETTDGPLGDAYYCVNCGVLTQVG